MEFMMSSVFKHRYFIWTLMAIPLVIMAVGAIGGQIQPHDLLHPSGEFSARFMIFAMFFGPLAVIFPNVSAFRWLLARRRYFGVAAFAYALLHTILYLADKGILSVILGEALKLSIWTGWLAFFIFVPLAVTSNNRSMRKMGRSWKTLQRLVYVAAVATAAHWLFLEYHIGPVLAHFVPLALLEIGRFRKQGQKSSVVKPA
jgi:methionine sulfoxide reductase heme-binding subunit